MKVTISMLSYEGRKDMIKRQKILSAGLISIASGALLLGLALAAGNAKMIRSSATECTHEHVEHYDANDEHIEHWACCECHHAWADSAKTIEISEDTTLDRAKIDFGSKYFHAAIQSQDNAWGEDGWEWTRNPLVIYDSEYNFAYSITENNLRQVFFESNDTSTVLATGKYYGMRVYNDSNATLDVTVVSREWGGSNTRTVQVAVGESAFVYGGVDLWNLNSKKGAAIRINVNDYSAFSGTIICSEIKILDLDENPKFYNSSYFNGSDWTWDAVSGFELFDNRIYQKFDYSNVTQAFIQSIDTATTVANNKLYVSHIINNTDKTLNVTPVSRGWNSAGSTFIVAPGTSQWVYGQSFLWNYNDNKGGTFRLTADSFSGEVLITAPKIVDEPIFELQLTDNADITIVPDVEYDDEIGFYYAFDGTDLKYFYITAPYIDPSNYSGVQMKMFNAGNSTSFNIWSGDWNGHGPQNVSVAGGEWTTFVVAADVWNGDSVNYRVELYDYNFTSEVRVAFATQYIAA